MFPQGLLSLWRHENPGYAVHHGTPLTQGGLAMPEITPLVVLPADHEALSVPTSRGLPPLMHSDLPAPEEYQIVVPRLAGAAAPAAAKRLPLDERSAFPVAEPLPASVMPSAAAGTLPDTAAPALPPVEPAPSGLFAQAGTAARPPGQRINPLYAYLIYMALGFGTLYLGILGVIERYTILWAVLIVLGAALTLVDARPEPHTMSSASLGWGFSIGLVFSLPLLILVSRGLADLTGVLFRDASAAMMFQSLAVVGPVGETLFFRGVLQERRGFAISVAAAGLSALLLYWPAASPTPVYLVAVVIFSTVLAGIYSFVRTRYGLGAALICQVTVNLLLLFAPGLLA